MIGIPTSTNTFAMFQNPNVIEQTGATFPDEADYTWDDYNDFIAEVSGAGEKTADGYALYGAVDYTGTFWFFIQWLLQKGITPFEDDGTFGFDEADIVEFLDLTADLRADKAVYPVDRNVSLAPKGGFTVNETASEMSWDTSWPATSPTPAPRTCRWRRSRRSSPARRHCSSSRRCCCPRGPTPSTPSRPRR